MAGSLAARRTPCTPHETSTRRRPRGRRAGPEDFAVTISDLTRSPSPATRGTTQRVGPTPAAPRPLPGASSATRDPVLPLLQPLASGEGQRFGLGVLTLAEQPTAPEEA